MAPFKKILTEFAGFDYVAPLKSTFHKPTGNSAEKLTAVTLYGCFGEGLLGVFCLLGFLTDGFLVGVLCLLFLTLATVAVRD